LDKIVQITDDSFNMVIHFHRSMKPKNRATNRVTIGGFKKLIAHTPVSIRIKFVN